MGVYFVDVKNLFRTVLKMYFGDAADLRAEVLILKKRGRGMSSFYYGRGGRHP